MTNYQALDFSITDRIATIRFNRPDAANGLNLQMATELNQVAQQCSNDANIKAVILTGSGRFFCAGGDLNSMLEHETGPGAGVTEIATQLHEALSVLARMDAPVITAINGTAAGAGFSIAVTGDLVVAAESAKFTMAYTKVGLSPDGSSSYYLPRIIGIRRTQELMFTNRVLSAQEAMDWGLVTKVVPDEDIESSAREMAQIFVSGAKGSSATVKSLLMQSLSNDLETQMALECQGIANCADSKDGKEGISAFIEKRKPEYE